MEVSTQVPQCSGFLRVSNFCNNPGLMTRLPYHHNHKQKALWDYRGDMTKQLVGVSAALLRLSAGGRAHETDMSLSLADKRLEH